MAGLQVGGEVDTLEGTLKEGAGKLTGDKRLEASGVIQQAEGKAKRVLGDARGQRRTQPFVLPVIGAVMVVAAAGLLRGLRHAGRESG